VHGKLKIAMFQDLSKPRVSRNLILETKTKAKTGGEVYWLNVFRRSQLFSTVLIISRLNAMVLRFFKSQAVVASEM
jgi:hypothetical protein